MRRFLILFSSAIAALLLLALALPTGELVQLHTVDGRGRDHASTLWVVEIDGALRLRSGNPESEWLERLRDHPVVTLERDGHTRAYRAEVASDALEREAVNEAMARKYGFADRLLRRWVDMAGSVPVRLDPLESRDAATDG